MRTVQMPPGVNPIAVKKYIISYIIYIICISKTLKGNSVPFSAVKCVRRCNVSCNKAAICYWTNFLKKN